MGAERDEEDGEGRRQKESTGSTKAAGRANQAKVKLTRLKRKAEKQNCYRGPKGCCERGVAS